MITPAPEQGDKFETHRSLYHSDRNVKFFISTRFDGNGNSIVRFIVAHEGKETSFEKYDAAVNNYNHKLFIQDRDARLARSG